MFKLLIYSLLPTRLLLVLGWVLLVTGLVGVLLGTVLGVWIGRPSPQPITQINYYFIDPVAIVGAVAIAASCISVALYVRKYGIRRVPWRFLLYTGAMLATALVIMYVTHILARNIVQTGDYIVR